MNTLIFKLFSKRLNNSNRKMFISSLQYYVILALIPTFLLSISILKILDINIYSKYKLILDAISVNFLSSITISIIVIYMISRVFFNVFKARFSISKSIILSVFYSFLLIIFLTVFLSTYIFENLIINYSIKFFIIMLFFFIILYFLSLSDFKNSLLFSSSFSLVANLFIYFFTIVVKYFINYEQYYGLLSPIFIVILAINILIYIANIFYIGAEEFTKISNIKFIKS